jgi:hypothetical protein
MRISLSNKTIGRKIVEKEKKSLKSNKSYFYFQEFLNRHSENLHLRKKCHFTVLLAHKLSLGRKSSRCKVNERFDWWPLRCIYGYGRKSGEKEREKAVKSALYKFGDDVEWSRRSLFTNQSSKVEFKSINRQWSSEKYFRFPGLQVQMVMLRFDDVMIRKSDRSSHDTKP